MNADDNLCILAKEIFSYFNRLRDYVNILATSKSNRIKDTLLHYFSMAKTFEFPFDIFGSSELLNYIAFFSSLEYLSLNQYQRQLTKTDNTNSECKDDLVDFLNAFHAKFPTLSNKLKLIRIISLAYDNEYKEHYYSGKIIDINSYSDVIDADSNCNNKTDDNSKKFASLKAFISFGNWSNMISPKHVEYISTQANDINCINISNMAPIESTDDTDFFGQQNMAASQESHTIFQTFFAKHRNLIFFRIRNSQNYECSPIATILPSDFENAYFDKLKILMIQNNLAFRWNETFIDLLQEKLNADAFIFLYLTFEGSCCGPVRQISGNLWTSFKNKFTNVTVQKRQLRDRWPAVIRYHNNK